MINTFAFEGNFLSTSPRGVYIWRGDLTESFLRYRFGGLIFGGAYTWRGLFSEFYGTFWSEITSSQLLDPFPRESHFFRVAADKKTEAADETNFQLRVGSTARALATPRNIFKVRTLPHLQSYLSVASYV